MNKIRKYILEQIISKNQLLNEKFYNGFKSKHGYAEIYVNPTSSDFEDLWSINIENYYSMDKKRDMTPEFRGVIMPNGDLYVWNVEIIHHDALPKFGNYVRSSGDHVSRINSHIVIPVHIAGEEVFIGESDYGLLDPEYIEQTKELIEKAESKNRYLNFNLAPYFGVF